MSEIPAVPAVTDFKVGDHDPTPQWAQQRRKQTWHVWCCRATSTDLWVCTWTAGHDGSHVAGASGLIAAVWP